MKSLSAGIALAMSMALSLGGCKEPVPTDPFENIHDPQAPHFLPYPPTALTLAGYSESSVTLRWADSSKYITGFVIDRRVEGGSYYELARVQQGVFQFRDSTVSRDIDYSYRVVALADTHRSVVSDDIAVGYRPAMTLSRSVPGIGGWFSLSPDGRQIIVRDFASGQPALYKLVDVATGQTMKTFQRDGVQGTCVPLFTPDGQHVLIGYSDTTICLWSTSGGDIVRTFSRAGGPFGSFPIAGWVKSMDVSPDGTLLAAGMFDLPEVDVWDISSGALVQQLPNPPSGDSSPYVKFSGDGGTLAVISRPSTLWNTSNWTSHPFPVSSEFADALSFDPSSTHLTWATDLNFTVCDILTGQPWVVSGSFVPGPGHNSWVLFMPVHPFYWVHLQSDPNALTVYRLFDRKPVAMLPCIGPPECVRFSSDEMWVFTGTPDGLDIWSLTFRWELIVL